MNPYVCGDFVRTIGAAGAYANETAFLAGVACDISANDTQVFGLTAASDVFHDLETITGQTSGFTGVVVDATATQVLVKTVTGTPIPYETVRGGTSTHTATITDRGRLANLVGEWIDAVAGGVTAIAPPVGLVTGRVDTIRPIRFVIFRPAEGFQATGKWDATRKRFTGLVTITIPYCRFEGVGVSTATGGIVVNAGTPTTSLVVIGSCIVPGPTTKTGNPNGVHVTSGKVLVAGCGIYEWQNAAGIYATGANSEVHVYQNTLYHNQTGILGASSAAIYVDSNIVAQCTYPMVNVSENDNNVTSGSASTYGFSIPNGYGDGLTYDLHSGAQVLGLTDPTVAIYMKASAISEDTNGVGYYHPRTFDYRVRPERPPNYPIAGGPSDIGADDYHATYTPSGAGVEVLSTTGNPAKKFRLTANKTANGTAFVIGSNDLWLSGGAKTVTYANNWHPTTSMSYPMHASPYSTDTVYVADAGNGDIAPITVGATGTLTMGTRIGSEGSGNANLLCPTDVVRVGASLYIADLGHKRVVKLNATTGAYEAQYTFADPLDPTDVRPISLTTNGTTRLYVTDHCNPYIYVFDLSLAMVVRWDISALGLYDPGASGLNESLAPQYGRCIRYNLEGIIGYLYVAGHASIVKIAISGDVAPTANVWRVTSNADRAWAICPTAQGLICKRFYDPANPDMYMDLRSLSTGALTSALMNLTGPYLHASAGYGMTYQNGFVVMTNVLPDLVWPTADTVTWPIDTYTLVGGVMTAVPASRTINFGTVSGFFAASRTAFYNRFHSADVTTSVGGPERWGIYDTNIVKGSGAGYSTGIYACYGQHVAVTDNTFSHGGYGALAFPHMNGSYSCMVRNRVASTSRLMTAEDRLRHKKWAELAYPEGGSAHTNCRLESNIVEGGCVQGIYSYVGTGVVIRRNFVNLDNWCFAQRSTPTNSFAIFGEAVGASVTLNEVSNRGGSLYGAYSATGAVYQYNRGAGCGRPSEDRYNTHGMWARAGSSNFVSDNNELMVYKRYTSDKYMAPIHLGGDLESPLTGQVWSNLNVLARLNGQSYQGMAAVRLQLAATGSSILVRDSTLDSDGGVVGLFFYSDGSYQTGIHGVTFRDCTLRQNFGQSPGASDAHYRETFYVDWYSTADGDLYFEDCTYAGFANPRSVSCNATRDAVVTLRHHNHMKVTVTDAAVPVSGATVSVYDKNGVVVATGTTGVDGTCIPLRVGTTDEHIHVTTWTADNNTGSFTDSWPFDVVAVKATKSGNASVTLLTGPNETVAIPISVGGTTTAPTITRCMPASGTTLGGTDVTITGTGFVTGPPTDSTVQFDGVAATAVVIGGATSLTCKTPAHAQGMVTVTVTNPDAKNGFLSNGFTYQTDAPLPTTDFSDDFVGGPGALGGDWTVVSSGVQTILQDATTHAYCDTNSANDVMAFYDTAPVAADQFSTVTYNILGDPVDPGIVTAWTRVTGTLWGVDLTGYFAYWLPRYGYLHLYRRDAAASVSIGSYSPYLTGRPGTGTLTLQASGTTLTVTLTDANGTATFNKTDATYATGTAGFGFILNAGGHATDTLITSCEIGGVAVEVPPTMDVTGVTPLTGGTSGGEPITVIGTDFWPGARVFFGSEFAEAASVTWVSGTELTALTPSGMPMGAVDVRAMNPNNIFDEAQNVNFFTFVSNPTVVSLSQVQGSTLGGSEITITGTEFFLGATVWFGTAPSLPTIVSRTELRCTTPAHVAGVVGVTVTNIDGGTATLATSFTFVSPPPGPPEPPPGENPGPSTDPGQGKLNIYFGGVATLTLPTKTIRSAISRGNVAAIKSLQWVNGIEQTKLAQVTKPKGGMK